MRQTQTMAPINQIVVQELAALVDELQHHLTGRNQYILRWAFFRLVELERRIELVRSAATTQRREHLLTISNLQLKVQSLAAEVEKAKKKPKPKQKRVKDYRELLAYT